MKLSEYPNEAIEAAAVSAETWDQKKHGVCCHSYVSESGYGWPAVKLSQFEGSDDEAATNYKVRNALKSICSVVIASRTGFSYLSMIDDGRGSEVAAIIRSHKTPTK